MDSVIRTFDIPTGRLIDAFRTASIATSVSFSPTGDFLATSHVDSVGVYLWCVLSSVMAKDVLDYFESGRIERSMVRSRTRRYRQMIWLK